MFVEDLFIIPKNQKQPKYPSSGEQINKQWCMYKLECDLAVKVNRIQIHATSWISFECVI